MSGVQSQLHFFSRQFPDMTWVRCGPEQRSSTDHQCGWYKAQRLNWLFQFEDGAPHAPWRTLLEGNWWDEVILASKGIVSCPFSIFITLLHPVDLGRISTSLLPLLSWILWYWAEAITSNEKCVAAEVGIMHSQVCHLRFLLCKKHQGLACYQLFFSLQGSEGMGYWAIIIAEALQMYWFRTQTTK